MKKYIISSFMIIILIFFIKDKFYTNDTIILGSSIPKSGIMKELGKNVEIGANAYFKYANDKKIISNKKIKLITYDDKYEPELTAENTKNFLEDKDLFALFGYVGTPTVKKILPTLEKSHLPFLVPFTGASFLRNTSNEHFINFRSSYKEEIEKIVNYLNEKKDITKFAVFYQNDDYGEEGFISLIESLKKKNLKLQGEGTYKRNTLSIKHAFEEIKDSQPQAVILVGSYNANALFIKRAKEDEKLKNAIFCNISFSAAKELITNLNYKTKNLIFSQVVPYYDNNSLEIIREYQFLMKKYYPKEPLNFVSLEAFLSAKVVVKALSNIDGIITYKKFLNEFKKLPSNTLKGINIKYKNTQLLNKVYLFEYKNSKFEEIKYEQ